MSKVCDFIRECEVFYLLTINKDFPAGRPFGAIMEYENDLYVSTSDTKEVYRQLKENGNVQIIALKEETREWVRVSGVAKECNDLYMKQKMIEECPILSKHYASADAPHYSLFQIKVENVEFN